MAESEDEEEIEEYEESTEEDGESTEEGGDSDEAAKKKKQMMMLAGLIVGVVLLLGIVGFFFSGSGSSEEEEEEGGYGGGVAVLTGYGELLIVKIPDLTPIPYSDAEDEKGQKSENGAESDKKNGNKSIHLPNGEVIYTVGDQDQSGDEQTGGGVVMVDQMQVQNGENSEKLIQARVQNRGGRFLADVRIEVLFFNSRGKPILSRGINPLVISGGLFGDKVQTLAPGSSRIFFVDATDIPPGWSEDVSAKVISYRFAK